MTQLITINLIENIKELLLNSRQDLQQTVNTTMVKTY